jgi:hypothetical protein
MAAAPRPSLPPPIFAPSPPSRLLGRLADALRSRGYVASIRQAYVDWVRRYILFHGKRHPQEMGAVEVTPKRGQRTFSSPFSEPTTRRRSSATQRAKFSSR